MKRLALILGLQLIAFWEVWHWYVTRAVYSWDQPWGVVAFVAAILFLILSRKRLPQRAITLVAGCTDPHLCSDIFCVAVTGARDDCVYGCRGDG